MPHGCHIYARASDMEKATMCTYPQSYRALPQCKCVLLFCSYFPRINLPDQETNKNTKEQNPLLSFTLITSLAVALTIV